MQPVLPVELRILGHQLESQQPAETAEVFDCRAIFAQVRPQPQPFARIWVQHLEVLYVRPLQRHLRTGLGDGRDELGPEYRVGRRRYRGQLVGHQRRCGPCGGADAGMSCRRDWPWLDSISRSTLLFVIAGSSLRAVGRGDVAAITITGEPAAESGCARGYGRKRGGAIGCGIGHETVESQKLPDTPSLQYGEGASLRIPVRFRNRNRGGGAPARSHASY